MLGFNIVAAFEVHLATRRFFAKERPTTLFESAFFDMRLQMKSKKREIEKSTAEGVRQKMVADLESKGVKVVRSEISLGSYRGSGFITSCPLDVTGVTDAAALQAYLQKTYSPKWRFKGQTDGVFSYNVR